MTDQFRAGKRLWSAADDALLRRRYPDEATVALARTLRRSPRAVYARAKLFGIGKSAAYLASPEACRLRRGDNIGAPFRFPPGHVPANKGMRRPGYGPGRMKQTQFRKGNAPHTWVPIGTEVLDDEGYRKRKIADDRSRPSRFNWKYVHVLIWESAHGPVPTGHCLTFRNGDKADIRLDNLVLITRRQNMARNTVHNLPKPLAQTIQLLGALRRKLRRKESHEEQDR